MKRYEIVVVASGPLSIRQSVHHLSPKSARLAQRLIESQLEAVAGAALTQADVLMVMSKFEMLTEGGPSRTSGQYASPTCSKLKVVLTKRKRH